MNAIYKIIGQDGHEYGPATAEQIRQWVSEGRVERQTPVFMDGAKDWNFVGQLPEFTGCFAASGTPPLIAPPPRGASTAGRLAKTNSYAQAGMIFGILSVTCCCGFPLGILGLVFSLIGLSQINANPQLHEGRGMAIAGLILSILSLLLGAGWMFFNLAMSHPHIMWNVGQF
ncbi:MAG: DUF4190 domain-containing protein [Verrucomicrobiales bacterium]|nr:DUF4190 domain-containing protein [Verrucomicrobiales bacterium]